MAEQRDSHARQVIGSLVAAVVVVLLTVVLVTANLGAGVETREREEERGGRTARDGHND